MSVRSIIRQHIVGDSNLTDLIKADHWYASSAITDDNRPTTDPFAVMRYGIRNLGIAQMKRSVLEIRVNDDPGTYSLVDRVLEGLYSRLDGVAHLSDEGGSEVVAIEWFSSSGDLYDPGFRTIVKTTTFNLVTIGE